jgi:hypothetical protein
MRAECCHAVQYYYNTIPCYVLQKKKLKTPFFWQTKQGSTGLDVWIDASIYYYYHLSTVILKIQHCQRVPHSARRVGGVSHGFSPPPTMRRLSMTCGPRWRGATGAGGGTAGPSSPRPPARRCCDCDCDCDCVCERASVCAGLR